MIAVEESILIRRPPSEVFEFVANLENAPRWQSGLTHSTRITEGPLR